MEKPARPSRATSRGGDGSGLDLARRYFHAVVEPVLERRCPGLGYAAARVGQGSEVLDLDDAMSRDHDWGLRLQLFVPEARVPEVLRALDDELPATFEGHSVRLVFTGQATGRLGVDVTTLSRFAHDRLGFDPSVSASLEEWLSVSGQAALEVVSGAVFRDDDGDLTRLRDDLAWYPDDLWRYVVATDWRRIDQELPLAGRAGDRGDELGSRVIAARLVDTMVHLAFRLSRRWAPYPKWRGTMFRTLPLATALGPDLDAALTAGAWREREAGMERALEHLRRHQAHVGLPTPSQAVEPFFDRPYLQVEQTLVPLLLDGIVDPAVRALPAGVGSVEQHTDNVDVLVSARRRREAARLTRP